MKPACMYMCFSVTLLVAAILPGELSGPASGSAREAGRIEVTFLANAGFMIRGASGTVLIDAFVDESYAIYGSLRTSDRDALSLARAPFDDVTIALASHVHRDHFQPAIAARFLRSSPQSVLPSSPQVIETLRGPDSLLSHASGQVQSVWPEYGTVEIDVSEIKITFAPLRHGNERNYGIQHLGHLIQFDDVTLLHVGDAEMLDEHYARHDLKHRDIDIAFIPYWFLLSSSGQSIVEHEIAPRRVIVMHIPPAEAEDVSRKLMRMDSTLIIAAVRGDSWSF